ncbi:MULTISPECIES: Uma2 family endonuclease [unclassified Microcoleus]|uniref:Uma2 family endonuclease n=1 Tax=unclassified Microcoleus TaxID=2642155 RepID=UPI001DE233E5|nr:MULTISPECIES: Uma2 family endonuclease [unclassified Microcoleus]TAF91456.1 MAG: Uma2 family endonuclease [Oscillatoriales cyanobacterium]MCC3447255.1 Uma2 family endonuclease [Microcoleus sp. PH2017_09_SFU_O_A]MCC3453190.1 Uma2 family endonuclease [Microcoleus sp. PH2017_08_TRC_O_A]MCC3628239.1 Uma2 family endonuclease [Microcoleus sp. PH2017_39_LGB_O_B]MCC3640327.1 Uma2 family endonuclease [Microcoleus sp. PH2017_33_LGB_O_A]
MTVLTQQIEEEIEYPSSDGEPMAESDITRDYMTYGVEALKQHFQGRSDVYVSANSFVYYEEGNKSAVVAPDIYVVFGVRKRQRDNYKIWKEAGIAPQFVLEITSETTQDVDQETKPEIYRSLGVREYFQYDPSGDYLNPILQGVRLVNNQYDPIPVNNIAFDTLWLYSEVLGLELHLVSGELRFRNPQTGEFLKTYQQSEQERRAEHSARLAEQQARLAEQQARLAAESALRSLVSQLLKSEMNLEQVAQMMNLSTSEVERLVGRNE